MKRMAFENPMMVSKSNKKSSMLEYDMLAPKTQNNGFKAEKKSSKCLFQSRKEKLKMLVSKPNELLLIVSKIIAER